MWAQEHKLLSKLKKHKVKMHIKQESWGWSHNIMQWWTRSVQVKNTRFLKQVTMCLIFSYINEEGFIKENSLWWSCTIKEKS